MTLGKVRIGGVGLEMQNKSASACGVRTGGKRFEDAKQINVSVRDENGQQEGSGFRDAKQALAFWVVTMS